MTTSSVSPPSRLNRRRRLMIDAHRTTHEHATEEAVDLEDRTEATVLLANDLELCVEHLDVTALAAVACGANAQHVALERWRVCAESTSAPIGALDQFGVGDEVEVEKAKARHDVDHHVTISRMVLDRIAEAGQNLERREAALQQDIYAHVKMNK